MAVHDADIPGFRAAFPAFANPVTYTDAQIEFWFKLASCEINPVDGCIIQGDCLQMALWLCMAHIGYLMTLAAVRPGQTGAVQSSTIDKVSVTFQVPPYKSGWQFWLSQSPYGLQLGALLSAKGTGGAYIGGRPELSGFRKIGGRFL